MAATDRAILRFATAWTRRASAHRLPRPRCGRAGNRGGGAYGPASETIRTGGSAVSDSNCTAASRVLLDYDDDSITVERAGGFQTCPGNPDTQFTLPVSEPVGDRVIKDGRSSPPMKAQITYRR